MRSKIYGDVYKSRFILFWLNTNGMYIFSSLSAVAGKPALSPVKPNERQILETNTKNETNEYKYNKAEKYVDTWNLFTNM